MEAIEFNLDEIPQFKERLLLLSKEYHHVSILDSNDYRDSHYSEYDLIAGFGAKSIVSSNRFCELEDVCKKGVWLFGFLSYDLKNELETLNSQNEDRLGFPGLIFFEPEIRVEVKNQKVKIEGLDCCGFKKAYPAGRYF